MKLSTKPAILGCPLGAGSSPNSCMLMSANSSPNSRSGACRQFRRGYHHCSIRGFARCCRRACAKDCFLCRRDRQRHRFSDKDSRACDRTNGSPASERQRVRSLAKHRPPLRFRHSCSSLLRCRWRQTYQATASTISRKTMRSRRCMIACSRGSLFQRSPNLKPI